MYPVQVIEMGAFALPVGVQPFFLKAADEFHHVRAEEGAARLCYLQFAKHAGVHGKEMLQLVRHVVEEHQAYDASGKGPAIRDDVASPLRVFQEGLILAEKARVRITRSAVFLLPQRPIDGALVPGPLHIVVVRFFVFIPSPGQDLRQGRFRSGIGAQRIGVPGEVFENILLMLSVLLQQRFEITRVIGVQYEDDQVAVL